MMNFIKNLGPTEIIILAVVLIALFGSKVFVHLGRTAGQSLKEIKGIKKTFTEAVEDEPDKNKKEGAN